METEIIYKPGSRKSKLRNEGFYWPIIYCSIDKKSLNHLWINEPAQNTRGKARKIAEKYILELIR
jgi:hypothetical protein